MDEWRQPKEENWWVTVVNRDVELRTHEEHKERSLVVTKEAVPLFLIDREAGVGEN